MRTFAAAYLGVYNKNNENACYLHDTFLFTDLQNLRSNN